MALVCNIGSCLPAKFLAHASPTLIMLSSHGRSAGGFDRNLFYRCVGDETGFVEFSRSLGISRGCLVNCGSSGILFAKAQPLLRVCFLVVAIIRNLGS
jgi:hypothetical protein